MNLYRRENDPYLNDDNVVRRLLDEWNQYGILIIAFDYDNTVYDYHNNGVEFPRVIALLRECKLIGAHIVCFTSCDESRYGDIREYLKSKEIPCDAINETPDFIPFKGRKVYFNILLDDRAGLASAYQTLHSAAELRRIEKSNEQYRKSQDIEF